MTTNPTDARVPIVSAGSESVRITRPNRDPVTVPLLMDDAGNARRVAAEIRGAVADAYHAGRDDGLALPHLEAHEIADAPERDEHEHQADAERVTWSLHFTRTTDGEPNDYETHVTGPAPDTLASSSALAVPADVRAFAHYTGRANDAQRVDYAVCELAQVDGYAATGAVSAGAWRSTIHSEPIG